MAEERLVGHAYTERITIPTVKTRVRYRNEFHMKNFYIMLHNLFIEKGWATRKDPNWPEHYYLNRETQAGKEMWIWWRFKKIPGDDNPGMVGHNSYYRYDLDIFWHIMLAKDIEVMKDGKKFKTNTADLELALWSRIEMDYQHESGKGWRDSPILKHFNDVFHKRMFKADIEKHKHDLYRETYQIQDVIKIFLGLKTYMPEKEGQDFWPEKGSGDLPGIMGTQ